MTHAEYLTAHAFAGEHSGYTRAPRSSSSGVTACRRNIAPRCATRGNQYTRGVPELPTSFARLLDGDHLRVGATDWRVIEGHGHSPEHASLYAPNAAL